MPALAGMFIGQALRQKMSVETFRKVFFVGLLVLGAYLALEAAVVRLPSLGNRPDNPAPGFRRQACSGERPW